MYLDSTETGATGSEPSLGMYRNGTETGANSSGPSLDMYWNSAKSVTALEQCQICGCYETVPNLWLLWNNAKTRSKSPPVFKK
jgi:hypothetical protein